MWKLSEEFTQKIDFRKFHVRRMRGSLERSSCISCNYDRDHFLKWLSTSIQKHVCFFLDIHFFQLPSYDQSLRNHWVKSSKIMYMDSVKRLFEGNTLRVFPITVLEENAWKTSVWKRCWSFDRTIINFSKRSIPLKFVSMMRFWALFTKHFVFCGFFNSMMRICSFFTPIHFRYVFSMVLRDVS